MTNQVPTATPAMLACLALFTAAFEACEALDAAFKARSAEVHALTVAKLGELSSDASDEEADAYWETRKRSSRLPCPTIPPTSARQSTPGVRMLRPYSSRPSRRTRWPPRRTSQGSTRSASHTDTGRWSASTRPMSPSSPGSPARPNSIARGDPGTAWALNKQTFNYLCQHVDNTRRVR